MTVGPSQLVVCKIDPVNAAAVVDGVVAAVAVVDAFAVVGLPFDCGSFGFEWDQR